MTFIDKFTMLCATHGVSPSKVCESVGLARSSYSRWRKGERNPNNESKALIAKYFDIPVEEILDDDLPFVATKPKKKTPHEEMSKQEKELIDIYRGLSLKGQMHLIYTAMELKDDDK